MRAWPVANAICYISDRQRRAMPDILMEMPDPTALLTLGDDFGTEYGMLAPEQTIIVRGYSDDSDDTVLAEIQPRYVIMYEPNLEFVRRLEVRVFAAVYRSLELISSIIRYTKKAHLGSVFGCI